MSDRTQDLTIPGEEFLVDLINRVNPNTKYTVDQLVIGNPTPSMDERYNTDIEVTVPNKVAGGDPVTLEFHYPRYDLGSLFSTRQLSFPATGVNTVSDLIPLIAGAVPVAFDALDLEPGPIVPGSFPHLVMLRAAKSSLRFTGQFYVELVAADNDSAVTAVASTENASVDALGQRPDGTLLHGIGNRSTEFLKVTNGELEIALSAGLYLNHPNPIPSTNKEYAIAVPQGGDWNFSQSVILLDATNGNLISEQYDVDLSFGPADQSSALDFRLVYAGGRYRFLEVDDSKQFKAVGALVLKTGTTAEQNHVYQDLQRLGHYVEQLGLDSVNTNGVPVGDYRISLKAKRKNGQHPELEAAITVKVTG